jgi:hypothetical protein
MFDARGKHRCFLPLSELRFKAYPGKPKVSQAEQDTNVKPDASLKRSACRLQLSIGQEHRFDGADRIRERLLSLFAG